MGTSLVAPTTRRRGPLLLCWARRTRRRATPRRLRAAKRMLLKRRLRLSAGALPTRQKPWTPPSAAAAKASPKEKPHRSPEDSKARLRGRPPRSAVALKQSRRRKLLRQRRPLRHGAGTGLLGHRRGPEYRIWGRELGQRRLRERRDDRTGECLRWAQQHRCRSGLLGQRRPGKQRRSIRVGGGQRPRWDCDRWRACRLRWL